MSLMQSAATAVKCQHGGCRVLILLWDSGPKEPELQTPDSDPKFQTLTSVCDILIRDVKNMFFCVNFVVLNRFLFNLVKRNTNIKKSFFAWTSTNTETYHCNSTVI